MTQSWGILKLNLYLWYAALMINMRACVKPSAVPICDMLIALSKQTCILVSTNNLSAEKMSAYSTTLS